MTDVPGEDHSSDGDHVARAASHRLSGGRGGRTYPIVSLGILRIHGRLAQG